jgi:hypothetical protein
MCQVCDQAGWNDPDRVRLLGEQMLRLKEQFIAALVADLDSDLEKLQRDARGD